MMDPRFEQGLTAPERRDLHRLWRALSAGNPRPTRRDLLRWSAIAAGAVATANQGIVSAAPRRAPRSLRQDAPVVEGAEISVPFDAYGQAITLDPHRSADYGGFWVMYPNVWGGFLRYDELGRIALDLADQIVRSQDGLRYTLTIREGATYASGNPVLAGHFLASWNRALDPANLSPMVAFMEPVRGFDAWIAGEEGAELGFSAQDDRSVVVELDEPATYFPSFLASFEQDPALSAELIRLDRSQATIRSLAIDFRQPPFDDVRVPRAFGLAF